eukprot:577879-Amphidinium_carterae.1
MSLHCSMIVGWNSARIDSSYRHIAIAPRWKCFEQQLCKIMSVMDHYGDKPSRFSSGINLVTTLVAVVLAIEPRHVGRKCLQLG